MTKTNFLAAAAAAVLFLTSCTQTAPSEKLTLNDGDFYFMGDTDACYISVKDGNIQFVGDDENMQYYYYAHAASHYLIRRNNDLSPGSYDDYESFCEGVKHGFHEEWVPYEIFVLPDPISRTVVFFDPYYDLDGNGPGGISMDYIDENNIGDLQSDRGGIDLIFTRIANDE